MSWYWYVQPKYSEIKVGVDRCVAPEWPHLTASLHTSAGGRLLSSRIWSSHRLLGRPGWRFHDESGSRPSDNSTWQCRAWWAGTVCGILAMCPKIELRRLTTCSMIGGKPVWFVTSMFRTWSCLLRTGIITSVWVFYLAAWSWLYGADSAYGTDRGYVYDAYRWSKTHSHSRVAITMAW